MERELYVQKISDYVLGNFITDRGTSIPLDQSLVEAGIIDSYGMISLLTFLEVEFEFRIPDEHVTKEHLGSIYKMADYVLAHKPFRSV